MPFIINGNGELLPKEAVRHIAEALDTWRGRPEAYVVFENRDYYRLDSVHAEEAPAKAALAARKNLSYAGPLLPPQPFVTVVPIVKPTGCRLMQLEEPVLRVVLQGAKKVVREFTVRTENRPPSEDDIEAIFFSLYGLDRFMMPYLTNVYGAEFAVERRREWLAKK